MFYRKAIAGYCSLTSQQKLLNYFTWVCVWVALSSFPVPSFKCKEKPVKFQHHMVWKNQTMADKCYYSYLPKTVLKLKFAFRKKKEKVILHTACRAPWQFKLHWHCCTLFPLLQMNCWYAHFETFWQKDQDSKNKLNMFIRCIYKASKQQKDPPLNRLVSINISRKCRARSTKTFCSDEHVAKRLLVFRP